jgi:hypothetical protein
LVDRSVDALEYEQAYALACEDTLTAMDTYARGTSFDRVQEAMVTVYYKCTFGKHTDMDVE